MLETIDRIQVAVPNIEKAVVGWKKLLGASLESKGVVRGLGCRKAVYRLGGSRIEFLEPDGEGPVSEAIAARGPHLFAAGVSCKEIDKLGDHLKKQETEFNCEEGQIFLGPENSFGMRIVVSKYEELSTVGDIDFLYEVTFLASDADRKAGHFAEMFALDEDCFVDISSDNYGYDGVLTLFKAGQLHRFEVITPNIPEKTMGRFFKRLGETYYMAYAESGQIKAIEERVREANEGFTIVPADKPADRMADSLFIHPPSLGGMMLGISRPSMAWSWSGAPERVQPQS